MLRRPFALAAFAAAGLLMIARSAAAQQGEPGQPIPLPGMYDGGYLVFQNADSSFKYWLDGRVQVDGADYFGGKNALANGVKIRRARIGVKTTLFRDWVGEIDVDFAGDAVEAKDVFVGYAGWENSLLRIGNFKEPFGLETLTSSKYITFLERSYIDNFSPDRHIGMAFSHWTNSWQATAGVFGQGSGDVDATGEDQGWGATGRFTIAPILRSRQVLHFGAAVTRRTPDAGSNNRVRFRARPETNVNQARYISTGNLPNVKYYWGYDFEGAFVSGPLTVQSEYAHLDVTRENADSNVQFWGGYVSASWFLTGESRPYVVSAGEFDRIFPKSRAGAWEVAARVSTMNLNDFSTTPVVLGGQGTNYTLGVNWYVNANFKFMANWVHVVTDVHSVPNIPAGASPGPDKFDIAQVRASLAL